MKILLFILSFYITSTVALSVTDTIEVVAGLIDGIIEKDDLEIIEACIQNAE